MFYHPKCVFDGSEDQLVKLFIDQYVGYHIAFADDWVQGKFYTEVRVPEINRRSDLIIWCKLPSGKDRLINIEFKLTDVDCVVSQATDHKKWADYSYIALPLNMAKYTRRYHKDKIVDQGLGLLYGNETLFIQTEKAYFNTYKGGKDKKIRNNVIEELTRRDNKK